MENKKTPYQVNLVYANYSKGVESVTPPKFVNMGGVPIMRLTSPNGHSLGVNLNFVHRFECTTENKDEEQKTDDEGNHNERNGRP